MMVERVGFAGGYMEKRDDFYIPDETAEWISLKKSEYLSKLIQFQTFDDFGFEEFHLFDNHLSETIENPDKSFELVDDNQVIRTYLRSFNIKEKFHQVVIGVLVEDKQNKATVFVPILSFVSRKNELVKEFCAGQVVTRPTLN
jgi:hypothetical protein